MAEEALSGKNWSRVAELYAIIADETDPKNPTGKGNSEILSALDSTYPLSKATFLVDMGCGNGQLISGILTSPSHAAQIPPSARIVAADVSQRFVDMTKMRRQQRIDEGQKVWERVEVELWDGRDVQAVKDGEVSHLVSSYCYFGMSGDDKGLTEARRILAPGGIFVETSMGWTTWGHLPSFVKEVRPDKKVPAPGEHWQTAPGVKQTLEKAGFKDVQAREYSMSVPFKSAEEAVEFVITVFPFMEPLMADMTQDEKDRTRALMGDYVRSEYPEAPFRMRGTGVVGWGRK